jgi:diaminopimelate decarboxylase
LAKHRSEFPAILDRYDKEVVKPYGFDIKTLDIGGGFTDTNISDMAPVINDSLNVYFPASLGIKVISEPGRYFAQKSHILVLNVIGKKIIYEDSNNNNPSLVTNGDIDSVANDKKIIYYLNDGVYGSFNCIFFDHHDPIILPFNERKEKLYKTTIFGPTCDSMDLITENIMLPELAIGEWVYVENFGAYTIAASSNFNGFKTSVCKYVFRS